MEPRFTIDLETHKIDGNKIFTQQDFEIIQQLPEIIKDNGEIGEFKLGNLQININSLEEHQNKLIICKK